MRLIDADNFISVCEILADKCDDKRAFEQAIWIAKDAPTIDAVPVVHGEWIKNEGRHGWHCSVCGEDDLYAFAWNCDKGENELQDRYCPNCGAKMDGGEDGRWNG